MITNATPTIVGTYLSFDGIPLFHEPIMAPARVWKQRPGVVGLGALSLTDNSISVSDDGPRRE